MEKRLLDNPKQSSDCHLGLFLVGGLDPGTGRFADFGRLVCRILWLPGIVTIDSPSENIFLSVMFVTYLHGSPSIDCLRLRRLKRHA